MIPFALLSWFRIQPGTTLARVQYFLYRAVEPVLRPVRRVVRPMGGLDLSFLVVVLVAQLVLVRSSSPEVGPFGPESDAWTARFGWLSLTPMDNAQAPSSILDTLRTVEFRLGLKGYNVDEVDEYLDRAAQEAEGLQEHVRQLNERLRQASERIAQLEREKRAAPARRRGAGRPAPAAARWWPTRR